MSFKG